MPAGQPKHANRAEVFAKKPGSQGVQPTWPLTELALPAAQSWQRERPIRSWNCPAPHSVHAEDPFSGANEPAAQGRQSVRPGLPATVPNVQLLHARWPGSDWADPTAHDEHDVEPLFAANVPGALGGRKNGRLGNTARGAMAAHHVVQLTAPSGYENLPQPHLRQRTCFRNAAGEKQAAALT